MQRLDTLCRYLGLNLLWLASQALLITAPGGTRAMLETVRAWQDNDDLPVTPTFLSALRRHGARSWLECWPPALALALLTADFAFVARMGEQRAMLFPATLALAIPVALVAANLQPILAGQRESTARAGYALALRELVVAPLAAAGTLLLTAAAVAVVAVQPLALLAIPVVAARLIISLRNRTARQS